MFHSLDRPFLYSAHKLVVQFDDYSNIKEGNGTCFFIEGPGERLSLVTNRHVLEPSYENRAKSHWKLARIRVIGFSPPSYERFECTVLVDRIRFPGSFEEDVALAPVLGVIDGSWTGHKALLIENIPQSILATDHDFTELFLADTLLFPGFPDWHDKLEGRPIMRRGALSSDPHHNYLGPGMKVGGRIIAYEAFSFEGSSGSPVFLPPFGVRLNESGGGNFRPQKLLGINGGHLKTQDGHRHHSGISYFFRSTIIRELLDQAP